MKVLFLSLLVSVLLSACASNPQQNGGVRKQHSLATSYDVSIYDGRSKRELSLKQAAALLTEADVVFLGEYHGNHGSHWLQAQLQSALYSLRPKQIVSMEQFSRDKQAVLNQYLKGDIGEVTLLDKAKAWPNYKASYRPLVEFAKQHHLPVIAANAPADSVRCIGRQGEAYLAKLAPAQRAFLAKEAFMNNSDYQQAFSQVMHGQPVSSSSSKSALSNGYLAQLSRDNTMAESILTALDASPGSQLIHLNGAFHSDYGLGTAALLKQRAPKLNVKVLSPVPWDSKVIAYDKGDLVYLVKPLPQQYANDAERNAAYQSMFGRARSQRCQ